MATVSYVNYFGTHTPWNRYCLDLAILAVAVWVLLGFKKQKMDDERQNAILLAIAFAVVSGLLCAVLLDASFTGDWRTWFRDGEKRFGLTFAGALLGFCVGAATHASFSGLGAHFALSFLLPPLAFAQAVGRIGCFIGGCCYGVGCDLGVSYPPGSYPYSIIGSAKVFPVQLVEAGCLFILFGLLLCIAFRFRGAVYLLGVGIIRFILEFFRGDVRGTIFGITIFSPQQILSVVFFVLGIILLQSSKSISQSEVPPI
jgi:phosphatidylglycerol:prolipoprotein diacylglycerol transferase